MTLTTKTSIISSKPQTPPPFAKTDGVGDTPKDYTKIQTGIPNITLDKLLELITNKSSDKNKDQALEIIRNSGATDNGMLSILKNNGLGGLLTYIC